MYETFIYENMSPSFICIHLKKPCRLTKMSTDILLVYPQMLRNDYELERLEQEMPPFCLHYLATTLLKEGYTVKIVDMTAEQLKKEDLVQIVKKESPGIVGITATTLSYFHTMKIAEALKADNPDTTVVVGGPHVTTRPVESLQETDGIDIVVYGEGDYTIVELAHSIIDGQKPLEEIKGIAYRRNGSVQKTPPRPFIENLDELPFPAVLLPMDRYMAHPVSGGRGCPNKCIFCAAGHLSGHTYRFRSAKSVIQEVKYVHDTFGIAFFFFTDDTFTVEKERTFQICEEIKKEGLDIEWTCEARVNTVSKEMLQKMKETGCIGIQFGVESGVQKILNSIKKGITVGQVKRAVTDTIDVGMSTITCSFIVGHPEDTVETVKETFDFVMYLKHLAPERGSKVKVTTPFLITVPYPGTYLYENAHELGIEILADSWEKYTTDNVLIRTKHLDEKTLRTLWCDGTMRANTGLQI